MTSKSHYHGFDSLLADGDVNKGNAYPRHLLFQLLRKRIKTLS